LFLAGVYVCDSTRTTAERLRRDFPDVPKVGPDAGSPAAGVAPDREAWVMALCSAEQSAEHAWHPGSPLMRSYFGLLRETAGYRVSAAEKSELLREEA
jgi:hypothetical protein